LDRIAETYAGRVRCCPSVSYPTANAGQTDGRRNKHQTDDVIWEFFGPSPHLLRCPQAVIFTVRRAASSVHDHRTVSSVCLCVCLSHSGIVSKRLNVESHKQHRTRASDSSFLTPKASTNMPGVTPKRGATNAREVGQN